MSVGLLGSWGLSAASWGLLAAGHNPLMCGSWSSLRALLRRLERFLGHVGALEHRHGVLFEAPRVVLG
eukprot:3117275-Pyramimonas_sp.AAC.1